MTIAEFDQTGWTPGMLAEYNDEEYPISSCDFVEKLIFMIDEDGDEFVARCENVKAVRRQ